MTAVASEPALAELSHAVGIDLAVFRPTHVRDRIERALRREGVSDLPSLARLLRRDEAARTRFRRMIAVSVSGLFRDPEQFALLERELLPSLVDGPGRVRVWSAGCADGSELHTIAILLDRLGALERSFLLGSDLLEENLALARRRAHEAEVDARGATTRLRWERRDLVHDDAPPGRWHLVACRNVAIYLTGAAKETLHEKLAAALRPGGILLLGRSERLLDPGRFGLVAAGPHAYRREP